MLFIPALFLLFGGCRQPQTNGWDGVYCYRWKEEYCGEEKKVEFLNTCSGEHEQLSAHSTDGQVRISGPEGTRVFSLTSEQQGQDEVSQTDCHGKTFVIRYEVFQVGQSILLETSWNDGQEHLRRTSYTRLD